METLGKGDYEILNACITGEGVFPITSKEQLMEMARKANDTFMSFQDFVSGMNMDMAKEIRLMRVDKGCTWRRVAEIMHEFILKQTGEDMWQPPSNQLMGMALCKKAAQLHGEDYMGKYWNDWND